MFPGLQPISKIESTTNRVTRFIITVDLSESELLARASRLVCFNLAPV